MGEYVGEFIGLQAGRKIDLWAKNAKNEGFVYVVTGIDVRMNRQGGGQTFFQNKVSANGVGEHSQEAHQPYGRQNIQQIRFAFHLNLQLQILQGGQIWNVRCFRFCRGGHLR